MMGKGTKRIAAGLVIGLMLAGCTATERTHGWMPSDAELAEIVPGIDTRASVEDTLGAPNTLGFLEGGDYYYISTTMRHYGPQRPQIVDREVVAIGFDAAGVVNSVGRYGLEDGQVVALNRRVTEGADGGMSFLRRLFGNIGGPSAESLLN